MENPPRRLSTGEIKVWRGARRVTGNKGKLINQERWSEEGRVQAGQGERSVRR